MTFVGDLTAPLKELGLAVTCDEAEGGFPGAVHAADGLPAQAEHQLAPTEPSQVAYPEHVPLVGAARHQEQAGSRDQGLVEVEEGRALGPIHRSVLSQRVRSHACW
jgi:hypothetical protein